MRFAAAVVAMVGSLAVAAEDAPPNAGGIAASSAICSLKVSRERVIAAIKKERRYAAEVAGVIDLAKLHEWQDQARLIDDKIAGIRAGARDEGMKILACSHPMVARLARCRNVYIEDGEAFSEWTYEGGEACRDPALEPYRRAVNDPL